MSCSASERCNGREYLAGKMRTFISRQLLAKSLVLAVAGGGALGLHRAGQTG